MTVTPWGVHFYCGVPRAGKTTRALQDLAACVAESGLPVLTIDSTGADNLRHLFHVETVREAIETVWGRGNHAAIIPANAVDVVKLASACEGGKDVLLFIDEIGFWLKPNAVPPPLERILRAGHHKRVALYATSQYVGDLAPIARQCASDFYCFRSSESYVLERLEKAFGFAPERVAQLERGEFLRWTRWDGVEGQPLPARPLPVGTTTSSGEADPLAPSEPQPVV